MFEIIFGLKTQSIFDIWTIQHLLCGIGSGILIKKCIYKIPKKTWRLDMIFVIIIVYLWEIIEYFLETGLLGKNIANWFSGVEFWPNRFIADPCIFIVGYIISKKWPKLIWPAIFICLIYLIINIFIFPNSMYLQNLLLQ